MVFGIIVSVLVSRLRLSLYNEAKYIGLAVSVKFTVKNTRY
jgi:hypothetical protein